jgi:dCTP deaminase
MLSDKRIIEEMEKGNIIIEPFKEDFLGTNSYDCCLGSFYYREGGQSDIFVDDPTDLERLWEGWHQPTFNWNKEKDYIPVEPGQTILAHTQEVIGTRNSVTCKMFSKSTTVRYGLSVCKCGGVGDVGYVSKWTMEISNHTRTRLWLPVGMKICQFAFYEVGETLKEYKGNYGQEIDFKPEHMLPKAVK